MSAKKTVVIEEESTKEIPTILITEGDVKAMKKEAKEESTAKRAKTNAAKKVAKEKLLDFLKENPKFELAKEIKLVCSFVADHKVRCESVLSLLRKAFVEAGSEGLSEMSIFKAFKIGQPEMGIKTRQLIKDVEKVEDRLWIQFFPDEELYKIIATGADMPSDWEGYVPADQKKKTILLKA